MQTTPRDGAWSSRIPILENPVFLLEMRHVWSYVRRPWLCLGGWRWHMSAPARRVAAYIVWLPFTIVSPYAIAAILRFLTSMPPRLSGAPPQAFPAPLFDPGALIVYSYALFGGMGLVQIGAFSFARERDQGVLESLVLCRLTAAEIVLGKVAAIALPTIAAATVAFLVWLLAPPLTDGSMFLGLRFAQSPRAALACLWLDALATSAAGAFLGVAVSAWCRSTRSAASGAMLVNLPLVLLLMPLLMASTPMLIASPRVVLLPAAVHPAVWALAGLASIAAFTVAQVRLDPLPGRVTPIPGGHTRVRLSARATNVSLLLLLLALLAGGGIAGYRAARSFSAFTSSLAPSPQATQALALVRNRQYAQALPLLEAEIRKGVGGPMAVHLWEAKAQCHQGLGQYPKALAAYEASRKVSQVPAQTVGAYAGTAECLKAMGKRKEAIEALRKAVSAGMQAPSGRGMLAAPSTYVTQSELLRVARLLASLGCRADAQRLYAELSKSGVASAAQIAQRQSLILKEGLEDAPRLGVRYRDSAPTTIDWVGPGSGAEDAGLRPADRVLTVDGKAVDGYLSMLRVQARHKPGETVPVVVERAGRRLTFHVRLSAPR